MNATISGDIIASTSLNETELRLVISEITDLFNILSEKYNQADEFFWGRLIKGDYVECYIREPKLSLRVALLLKTAVKKTVLQSNKNTAQKKKRDLFQKYAIRLAIGIGSMRTVDSTRGILDGEAIYLSGRKLDNKRSSNKEKIVIKNTMFFESADTNSEYCAVLVELLDVLLRNITARQAEVMYYKLLSFNELQIANKMGIKQATVNQHSTAAGWNAIEHTLNYFEQIPF